MPYAPGVQDISGQLRAQGIAQAGQAWSQAIGNIGKSLNDAYNGYRQDRAMTDQAMAEFAATARANPDILRYLSGASNEDDPNAPKLSPEILKSFSKVQGGDISLRDASILNTFGKTYANEKQKNLATQLAQYKVEEAKRTADFWKSINQPEATAEQPTAANAPAASVAAPQGGYGIPAVSLARFAPPAAGAPASAVAMASPAGGAAYTQAIPNRNDLAAAINAGMVIPGSSNPAQIRMAMQKMADERAKAANRPQVFNTQQDAQAAAEQLDKTSPIPGFTRMGKFDSTAKAYVIEPREAIKTEKQLSEEAASKEQAITDVKEANDFLKNLQTRGTEASNSLAHNLELKRLLRSGVETGPFESFKADAVAVASKFGFANKDQIEKANDFNKVRSLMMEDQIKFAQESTRGNLNTYEQKMLASAKANAENKLAGANEYLNDLVIAAKMKEADAIAEEKRIRDQFPNKIKKAQYLVDWVNDPKNSLSSYMQKAGSMGVPAAPSAGGIPTVSSQAEYDALPSGSAYIDSTGKRAVKRGK